MRRAVSKGCPSIGGMLAEIALWLIAAGLIAGASVIFIVFKGTSAKPEVRSAEPSAIGAALPTKELPNDRRSANGALKDETVVATTAARAAIGAELALPATWQERNPHIDPNMLHTTNPRAAEEFLRYVEILPHDTGGFIVNDVEPGSLYERLGLQSGDVIDGLDSITMGDGGGRLDTAEVRMEVFRDGQSVILTYRPGQ